MKAKVVILSKSGRMGNRLIHMAHFMGNAIEYGYTVSNLAFAEYANYFEGPSHDLLVRYPAKPGGHWSSRFREAFFQLNRYSIEIPKRLGIKWLLGTRILDVRRHTSAEDKIDLRGELFQSKLRHCHTLVVQGYFFRDFESFFKHRDAICAFLRPAEPYRSSAESAVRQARESCDVLIGMHVRRTDYRTYRNGEWFFDWADYARWARESIALFPDKSVSVLLCSDEQPEMEHFEDIRIVRTGGHFLEDLCALSHCDLILGPPSSFTYWASYSGNVRLRFVSGSKDTMALSDFTPADVDRAP